MVEAASKLNSVVSHLSDRPPQRRRPVAGDPGKSPRWARSIWFLVRATIGAREKRTPWLPGDCLLPLGRHFRPEFAYLSAAGAARTDARRVPCKGGGGVGTLS